MDGQHQRQTDRKLQVQCFMPKQTHTEYSAQTAAQSGNAQKRGFRNAPGIFSGSSLVCKHKKEGKRISYQ